MHVAHVSVVDVKRPLLQYSDAHADWHGPPAAQSHASMSLT
jgi:hypothetical protein